MIHGTDDDVVVWQQSLVLLKRFIDEGKLVDYFVYPDHGHGIGGKDRLHLNRKIEQYFDEHL
jgi:dipeptidyl-peptidase-4